jgi:hypothetical protein
MATLIHDGATFDSVQADVVSETAAVVTLEVHVPRKEWDREFGDGNG